MAATRAPEVDQRGDAREILERNPFDSITGPLDGRILDHPAFRPTAGETPPCDDARVVLIAASNRGNWSFAAIVGPDGMPVMRREGDQVAGRAVVGIGWDQVWLAHDGARCELRLGSPAKDAPRGPAKNPAAAPSKSAGPASTLERDLAARIRKAKDGSIEIDRTTLAELMEHYPEIVKNVRLSPEKDGLRLFGIRPGSVLAAFGLQNNDRLERVNGFDVRDPRQAIEVYAQMADMRHVVLTIRRGTTKQNLDLHVR